MTQDREKTFCCSRTRIKSRQKPLLVKGGKNLEQNNRQIKKLTDIKALKRHTNLN